MAGTLRRHRGRRAAWVALSVLALGASSLAVLPSASAAPPGRGSPAGAKYDVVGQAAPDECWQPPADPSTPADYGHYSATAPTLVHGTYTCPSGYVPKVNQAYVWGLTRTNTATTGDRIWFGTVANTLCLVEGSFLGETTPSMTSTWTCEFGSSPYATTTTSPLGVAVPAELGDWRPPELFRYTPGGGQPVNLEALNSSAADGMIQHYLAQTVGIRSAASITDPSEPGHKIIYFAGPAMSTAGGITVFAFHDNGTFIGATILGAYNDIRRWVAVGTSLYAGVGLSDGTGGAILKFTPTSDTATGVFASTEIATIPGDVAELTVAGDRLVAGTWPNFQSNLQTGGITTLHEAALYVSPADTPIATLSVATSATWHGVWNASNYEPDYAIAQTYGIGAMSYYDGYVYWGTMHVPGVATEAEVLYQEQVCGSTPTTAEALADFVDTNRAFSLYRIKATALTTAGTPTTTAAQLLYGNAQLPAYTCTTGWQTVDNNMGGVAGLYGTSGFGNVFNNYEWSMAVYQGQLYVGTMDWSYLAAQIWTALAPELGLPAGIPNPLRFLTATFGADLYRFSSSDSPAGAVFTNGAGNYLNYGVRNMLATDTGGPDTGLYLGMANPMNLATSKKLPPGGWELIDLTTKGH